MTLGGADVLVGANLDIAAGSLVALLGPSGCGKTTLLRAVAGLQDLDAGTVRLGDTDLARIPAERRGIGLVFQQGALFPHLTVAGNVAFGLPRRERGSAAVADALAMVGLTGMGERSVATLSGGQQQRVALARTLVTRPRLVLLDEPFSSLDAELRDALRREVADLLRSLGITTIVVTHSQEEAFALGDEVAVMFDGRVHQQATPAELYARPANPRVAAFLGDLNLLRGEAHGDVADTAFGAVPLAEPLHGAVDVAVRPEHLQLAPGEGHEVVSGEFYGHDAMTTLRSRGDGPQVLVRTLASVPPPTGAAFDVRYAGPPAAAWAA